MIDWTSAPPRIEKQKPLRGACSCCTWIHTVRLGKTKWGTLPEKMRKQIKGPVLKAFRHTIKLVEL